MSIRTAEAAARVGREVELSCVSDGDPTPNVTRYRPDGSLINTITTMQNKILVVMDDKEDFGQYRCMADNGLGPPVERLIEGKC